MKKSFSIIVLVISSLIISITTAAQAPTPTEISDVITWGLISGPYGRADVLGDTQVQALAIDPQTPSIIYAGTAKDGLFKSLDGGAIWTAVDIPHVNIIALAVEDRNPQTIYVATGRGVFKSTDGGGEWKSANTGLGDNLAFALKIDPQDTEVVYAGTNGGGVFKSTDGGAHWAPTALTSVNALGLAIDPQTSDIYVGTIDLLDETKPPSGAILKSTDGGDHWEVIREDFVRALATDPVAPATVYAGTLDNGLFKSTDGGANWFAVNEDLKEIISLEVSPRSSEVLYAGTGHGAFKSGDGGVHWAPINKGLTVDVIFTLAVDPFAPDTLYAGTMGGGVFKSNDGGLTWASVNRGSGKAIKASDVVAIAVDAHNPEVVYAGTRGAGVFRSTDGGSVWEALNEGLTNRNARVLLVDPSSPATVYVATEGGGIFKSSDRGLRWETVNEGLTNKDVRALVLNPHAAEMIYAGTWGDGVFKSSDGGARWEAVSEGLFDRNIRALALNPRSGTVYAGTGEGVFKRSIGGESSWTPVNEGLTNTSIRTLTLVPGAPDMVYVGTYGGGVFRSKDGGARWRSLFPEGKFYSMLVDPLDGRIIYAATGAVILMSQDGGATWEEVGTSGIPIRYVAIAPSDPNIIYAAGQRGVLRGNIDRSLLAPISEAWWPGITAIVLAIVALAIIVGLLVRSKREPQGS